MIRGFAAVAVLLAACRPSPAAEPATPPPSFSVRSLDDGVPYGRDPLVAPRGAGFRAQLPVPPTGRQDLTLPPPWLEASYWYAEQDGQGVALVGFADAGVDLSFDALQRSTARALAQHFPSTTITPRERDGTAAELWMDGPRWTARLQLRAHGPRLFLLLATCVRPCELSERWPELTGRFSVSSQGPLGFKRGAALASAGGLDAIYDANFAFTRLDTDRSLHAFRAVEPSPGNTEGLSRFAVKLALMATTPPGGAQGTQ